jgi:predicted patatin/cPLA2 family phospholipase
VALKPNSRISRWLARWWSRSDAGPRKKALVLEGGGIRGVFLAGVLQKFTDRCYFPWRLIIGSSAGALCGTAYAAGQIYIARDAFLSQLWGGEFISLTNVLRPQKHILDLDWLVETIIQGDDPLDIKRLRRACPVLVTATDCQEGQPLQTIYFSSKHDDVPVVLKASAAIPFLYRGFVRYCHYRLLDGAVLDPIPYQKALDLGFSEQEILVVLTRPQGYRKKQESFWIKALYENYYRDERHRFLVEALDNRYQRYNRILDDLENKHPDIQVIYPTETFKAGRLTRDREKILEGFEIGVSQAKAFLAGY